MTPEILNKEEFIVVGIRAVLEMDVSTADSLWRESFLPRRKDIKSIDGVYYEAFHLLPGDASPLGRYECVAGVAGTLESIPTGMVGWVIPAGKYACVTITGVAAVRQVYRSLTAEWLPDSGFNAEPSPVFAATRDEHPDSPDAVWLVHIPIESPEVTAQLKQWRI